MYYEGYVICFEQRKCAQINQLRKYFFNQSKKRLVFGSPPRGTGRETLPTNYGSRLRTQKGNQQ